MMLRAAAFSFFLGSIGCAETNIQAIQRLRPAYDTYRHHVADVVVKLPPEGSVTTESVPKMLFPAPVFFEDRMNDPRSTVEIIYLGERQENVSLSIRSPIHSCLAWTGPKNPLHPDVWDRRGGLGEECEAARKRPWLVLLRVTESALPAHLFMEAFLVYVPAWTIAGSFPVRVYGGPEAKNAGKTAFGRSLTSDFHQALGCELKIKLNQLPGGQFVFDHRRCDGEFLNVAIPASMLEETLPKQMVVDGENPPPPPPQTVPVQL
jgi:hypothetical protein